MTANCIKSIIQGFKQMLKTSNRDDGRNYLVSIKVKLEA